MEDISYYTSSQETQNKQTIKNSSNSYNKKISFNDLKIERLHKNHALSGFHCGVNDLDEFLKEDSLQQMRFKFNVTYICKYNSKIIGYFTICSDAIRFKIIKDEDKYLLQSKGVEYPNLPALKICRLGIHRDYQSNGIGTHLVSLIIRQALELSERVGLRFITVDAYFQSKSWKFYRDKFYFKLFPKEENKIERYSRNPRPTQTVAMYLDIHTL